MTSPKPDSPRPTPLSDEAEETVVTSAGRKPLGFVLSDFARQLERDRAELMEALKLFMDIEDEGGGLLTTGTSGYDLSAAIRHAQALLSRLETK